MALDPNDKRVNPEDELFWKKVREAFSMVSSTKGQIINVDIGTKRADVYWDDPKTVKIAITEIPPAVPTLIVPPGGE